MFLFKPIFAGCPFALVAK